MKKPSFLGVLLVAPACFAVGPDYERPALETPPNFSETDSESLSAASISAWWEVFGDSALSGLVDEVLAQNLDLKAAVESIEVARASYRATTGERLPALNGSGAVQRAQARGGRPGDVWSSGLGLSWELDLFGRVRRSVEASAADLDAAAANLQGVQVALAAETVANYLQLRSLQARLAIAQRNADGQRNSSLIAEKRFDAGMVAGLDPAQAHVNLAATESALPPLKLGIRRVLHRLSVLTGKDPRSLIEELSSPVPLPTAPEELMVGLPKDLLLNRPDLRALERQLAAQTARVGVATADLYPRFDLSGTWDWLAASSSGLFEDTSEAWGLGVPVSIPIFNGGRLRARVDLEDARVRELELKLRQQLLIAQEEVENALIATLMDRRQAEVLEGAVEAARSSVGFSRELYTSGQSDFQNVLDAERSLFEFEDQLAQTELNVLLDLVDLYRALGGGWR